MLHHTQKLKQAHSSRKSNYFYIFLYYLLVYAERNQSYHNALLKSDVTRRDHVSVVMDAGSHIVNFIRDGKLWNIQYWCACAVVTRDPTSKTTERKWRTVSNSVFDSEMKFSHTEGTGVMYQSWGVLTDLLSYFISSCKISSAQICQWHDWSPQTVLELFQWRVSSLSIACFDP